MAPHRQDRLFDTLTRLLALSATTVEGTMKAVSNLVGEVLSSDKVDAFLYDAGSSSLFAVGTSDTETSRKQRALGLDRLPLANGGRSVQVFREGTPHLCNDVAADADELPGIRHELGIRSTVAVPFDVQDRRRGVLQVSAVEADQYDRSDLAFLVAVARWVGVVTHRAELVEEATRAAAHRARQRAAEELLAVVAHDLRNHLAPLSMRLYVVSARAEQDGRHDDIADLAKLLGAVERLERVVTNLLDVERIERGLLIMRPKPLDLVELARETAGLFGTPGHDIRVDASASVLVDADPDAIRQALENLLHNAGKHSAEGATTTLYVTHERRDGADWGVVRVQDAGPGIAPELVSSLFDRFTVGPASSGLGLGLYLARSVAQAHGGSLTIEEPESAGACFRLALPLRALVPSTRRTDASAA